MTSAALSKSMKAFSAPSVKAHSKWSAAFDKMLKDGKLQKADWQKQLKLAEKELMPEADAFVGLTDRYAKIVDAFHAEMKAEIAGCAATLKGMQPGPDLVKDGTEGINKAELVKRSIEKDFRPLQNKVPAILQANRSDLVGKTNVTKLAKEAGLQDLLDKYHGKRKQGIDRINAVAKNKEKVNDYLKRAEDFSKAFERLLTKVHDEKGKVEKSKVIPHLQKMKAELEESVQFFDISGFRTKRAGVFDEIDGAEAKLDKISGSIDAATAQAKKGTAQPPDLSKQKAALDLFYGRMQVYAKNIATTYSKLLIHDKRIESATKVFRSLPVEAVRKKPEVKKEIVWLEKWMPELDKAVKAHKADGKKYKDLVKKLKTKADTARAKLDKFEKA